MKCKYCNNNNMNHISGDLDEYGSNKYKCGHCGTIASEVFGHGIHWKEGKGETKKCAFIKILKDGNAIIHYLDGTEENIPRSLIIKDY